MHDSFSLHIILGYGAAWILFAIGIFGGDSLLHSLVRHSNGLYLNSRWIGTGLLLVAGIFQWSSWKRYCLAVLHIVRSDVGRPCQAGWRYPLADCRMVTHGNGSNL